MKLITIFAIVCVFYKTEAQNGCDGCSDALSACSLISQHCTSNNVLLRYLVAQRRCRFTCKTCSCPDVESVGGNTCYDTACTDALSICNLVKAKNLCKFSAGRCKKSCGECKVACVTTTEPCTAPCADTMDDCELYKGVGECTTVKDECRKTCGFCTDCPPPPPPF